MREQGRQSCELFFVPSLELGELIRIPRSRSGLEFLV